MASQQNYWQFEVFGTDQDLIGFYGTAGIIVPSGTTAERPTPPVEGHIRLNTDTVVFEGFFGGIWQDIGSGGGGGGTFIGLSDTPGTYAGQANRVLKVNSAETDVEFTSNLQVENSGRVRVSAGYNTLVTTDDILANKKYVDDQDALRLALAGGTMTGIIGMGGNAITGLPLSPTGASEAASKSYVDSLSAGLDPKESVRAATLVAGTLASSFEDGDTIDGVLLSTGDRILIKNQGVASENGIYVVEAAGAPTRATDQDGSPAAEVSGGNFTFVEDGSQAGTGWVVVWDGVLTVGVDPMNWTQFSGGGGAFLPLAGGSMTGDIVMSAAGVQISGASSDTDATPTYSWTGDLDTGVYHGGANIIGFSTGGTSRWTINGSGHFVPTVTTTYDIGTTGSKVREVYADHFLPNLGAAGDPSYSFEGDTNTGMFSPSPDTIAFATGGTAQVNIESDGTLSVVTASYETLVLADNDVPNKKYVDDTIGAVATYVTVAGDSGSATAATQGETVSLIGATSGGITTTGSDGPDQVTFGLTPIDLVTGAATLALGDFIIVSDSADGATTLAQKYTFTDVVADLDIPNAISANGFVVRTAADTYASRTITVAGAGASDGLEITDGDGVAGNPVIGLDIDGSPAAGEDVAAADLFLLYNDSASANQTFTLAQVAAGVTSAGVIALSDDDDDTMVQVEESADEDIIRFDTGDTPVGYGAVPNIMTLASSGWTVAMGTANVAATAGAPISITAGTGNTTGGGGAITLAGGVGGTGAGGDGGDIVIQAGAAGAASAGDGGDIELRPGALDGAGADGTVRVIGPTAGAGEIRIEDDAGGDYVGFRAPSVISASYTLTFPAADASGALTSDGAGNLSFVAAGASDEIVDADGDTRIQVEESGDEDIIRFDTGDTPAGYGAVTDIMTIASSGMTIAMGTADTAATVGAPINITAGTGNTTGAGGEINITAGPGGGGGPAAIGGEITIAAGFGFLLAAGGDLNLSGGASSVNDGGNVFIRGGEGAQDGGGAGIDGGNVTIAGGDGVDNAGGGDVIITSGANDSASSNLPGNISISTPDAPGSANNGTGFISLTTGNNSTNSASSGDGGAITLTTGDGIGGSHSGGAISLLAGAGSTNSNGHGGTITITAGDSGANGAELTSGGDAGNVIISGGSAQTIPNAFGGNIVLNGGAGGSSSGSGGSVDINAGQGTQGGSVTIDAGRTKKNGQNGGDITVTAGNSDGGDPGSTRGGNITLNAGVSSNGSLSGGAISLATGAGTGGAAEGGAADGGDLTITTGASGVDKGRGGNISVTLGAGATSGSLNADTGGAFTMVAGKGGATADGGAISLTGGAGGTTSGDGGAINLVGGNADGGGAGGAINMTAGTGASPGGAITLTAGDSTGTDVGGSVSIIAGTGGTGAGGDGGSLVFTAGDAGAASAGDGGDIELRPGALDGTGADGVVSIIGGSAAGELRFQDDAGGDYVGFKAPTAVSASYTLNLPAADATGALTSDGAGNLSFVAAGASDAIVDADGNTRVQVEKTPDDNIVRIDTGDQTSYPAAIDVVTIASSGFNMTLPASTLSTGGAVGAPINMTAGIGSSGTGGAVNITGGSSPLYDGGAVTITGGANTGDAGAGGAVNIVGGDGSGSGGAVNITSGTVTETGGTSADVNITSGDGLFSTTSRAGDINITGGTGEDRGGAVTIQGGDGLQVAGQPSPDVQIIGAPSTAGLTTGAVLISTPAATGAAANSGVINLTTGKGGATSDGGDIGITTGDGGTTSGNGGDINLTGGDADGDGVGGGINLTAGESASTNIGGTINITGGVGGTGAGGDGGAVVITAGSAGTASAGDGGDIELRPGALDGAGVDGIVRVIGPSAGAGEMRFEDDAGGEYVGLQAPSVVTSSYTLSLPTTDSVTSGQALVTDGAGQLSFASVGSVTKFAANNAALTASEQFTHSLGSTDVIVQCYDLTASPTAQFIPASIEIDDANNVTVTLAIAPSATDEYRVVIMA